MSVICRTFVQNAWRNDLCSNCFKSLEDHSDKRSSMCEKLAMPRYVPQAPSLYQSRGISTSLKWRLSDSLYDKVSRRDFASQTPPSKKEHVQATNRGILIKGDSSEKKIKSRPTVDFAAEEAMVIGYGGNDYDSDTSPWEMGSDDGSFDLDLLDDTDEDRKITKITKNNTEFNSSNKNLLTNDNSQCRVKREEDKLNSINNNISNVTTQSDKPISIRTYNGIQSTKTDKKLKQYFFPSSTESINSYINGHGSFLVIEEVPTRNSNEQPHLSSSKIINNKQKTEMKDNTSCNISLNDNFSPLNTKTYSFVSEFNKSNANYEREQSSDSDYSTCRHTAGDSTDSESVHDTEDARMSPKPSFLHGSYTSPGMNECGAGIKYDAGSSTSGDVSNFSDDSDTHETVERTIYNSQDNSITLTSKVPENKSEEADVQIIFKRESHKVENQQQAAGEFQNKSALSNEHSPTLILLHDKSRIENETCLKEVSSNGEKISSSNALQHIRKEKESVQLSTLTSLAANITTTNSNKSNNNLIQTSGESEKSKEFEKENGAAQNQKGVPSSDREHFELGGKPSKNNVLSNRTPEMILAEQENEIKEEIIRDSDLKVYEENSDSEKSSDNIVSRQSKLAALALELEMARRGDSQRRGVKDSMSPQTQIPLPEIKARCSAPKIPATNSPHPAENFSTIKKPSAISCASRLSTLPDVLQETSAKQKKSKFSLKKLLKRNKDSGTFSPSSSSSKEVNPKAWKKQTFDRNRLSLEIVHPMDLMTSEGSTSAQSTPPEEHRQIVSSHPGRITFKGVSSRARSLSALPQLSADEKSSCALIECRKTDTVPGRKAGTVAERKKNRPALVRTPSCSALPNRTSQQSSERAPPPKPPPPPKCKTMHLLPPPPPPHNHPRAGNAATDSPTRPPPPPKVQEPKSRPLSSNSSAQEQNYSDKEYANLGDIRSVITPKKPQRPSAFSVTSRDSEMETKKAVDSIYETLPATVEEEEDHYTYLDESEMRTCKKSNGSRRESQVRILINSESGACGKPWLDLQTSYAALAAASYESLAELITTSLNEKADFFKKIEQTLKLKDFIMDSENSQVLKDRIIYNAVYRNESQERVTLVVTSRKQTSPASTRSQTRYPVLASFNDQVSKTIVSNDNYILQESEIASIHVLQQSKVTSVSDFAKASSHDDANQYIHLRNYCFVLLQLIHTLKSLQAEGIEEINYDLQIMVLVVTDEEKPPILVLFPEDKTHLNQYVNRKTLCQATLETMLHFLQITSADELQKCIVNGEHLAEPVAHTFRAIAEVLSEEKASSLSQAKGFLEYMLWGPVDIKVSQNELLDDILQRWLDLQRAQMVKSSIPHLLNKNSNFHVYEQYQLVFLLQATVKSLKNVISKL